MVALLTRFQIATLERCGQQAHRDGAAAQARIYSPFRFVLVNLFVAVVVINNLEESHPEAAQIPGAVHEHEGASELRVAHARIAPLDPRLERLAPSLPVQSHGGVA